MRPSLARLVLNLCGCFLLAAGIAGCSALHPPATETQVASFAARLGAQLEQAPAPLIGPLSEHEAVERAVQHNYSLRAKELEVTLAEAKARAQSGSMLPNIVAESDYYGRDRPLASKSLLSQSYSSSTDLRSVTRDMTLSWNILDFGLSFVRSRQALDKAYQQHEEARRIKARIVEETRLIYWRAVALQKLTPALARLDNEVGVALRLAQQQANDTHIEPLLGINFQRDLLTTQRELNQLHASIAGATDQIKQMVGAPLTDQLTLCGQCRALPRTELPPNSSDDIKTALQQRPEIRQHFYDLRITEDEVNAVILQMLPGVTFSRTHATDSNSFLLHGNWVSWGTRIAGNLMNLVRLPNDLASVDAQAEVHRANALATAAAIAMQVHVARAKVEVQMRAHRDAVRFAEAQNKILGQVRAAVRAEKLGRQVLIREQLAALLAEIRSVIAFADLQAAHSAYQSAIGAPSLRPVERIASNLKPAFIVE